MRFDGYYAFSDAIGVENLQQRAFALGRWQLRRTLFGLDDPVPEPLPRHRARLLIGYAWGTWIYRFFLFLGIALVAGGDRYRNIRTLLEELQRLGLVRSEADTVHLNSDPLLPARWPAGK